MLALSLGSDFIFKLITYLVPMILSLSVHEYAHAWAAARLGDDTAAREGRLTLSPLAHIDPIGTLAIPAINILLGGFSFIGWARPVPVNPMRFNRNVSMRTGMAITAIAGPLSNLLMAIISVAILTGLWRFAPQMATTAEGELTASGNLLLVMAQLNIGLFVFNLLPLPPLDGSRLLPRSFDELKAKVAPYSFVIILIIINVSALRELLLRKPIMLVSSVIFSIFSLA